MNAHQFTAGLYYTLHRQYNFSVEGYFKRMNNLIEYKDRIPVGTDYSNWEERVGMGYGRAYGMELMAQKKSGPNMIIAIRLIWWQLIKFPVK